MNKESILVTTKTIELGRITPEILDYLSTRFEVDIANTAKESKEKFLDKVKGKVAIICSGADKMDKEVIETAGKNLKVISSTSAGYDSFDLEVIKAHGIRVGTTGNAIANATAELAVTLLLTFSRRVIELSNKYNTNPAENYQQAEGVLGLENTVVGIAGAGRIGTSVAQKLKAFNIRRLLYFSRSEKPEMNILGGEFKSLQDIVQESDYLVLTLSLNKNTEKIMSQDIFHLMKPNAVFVNVARGGLVDQEALLEVLRNRKIAGAALDVTTPEPLPANHPLRQCDNVLLTPHCGGLTMATKVNAGKLAVENLLAALEGREMPEELSLR